MSFAHPWALLALLAVPVVLALHWFRRRLPSRRVAGLFLFLGAEPVPPEGRSLDRLRWTLPLLLECLLAAALALWLAGPVFGEWARPVHLLLVLDDSASMTAAGAQGGSAAGRARDEIERWIEPLGGAVVVTVVLAGETPEVALGPRAPLALLDEVLDGYAPAATGADLGAAAALADVLAEGAAAEGRGGERIDRLMLTDRPVGAGWSHWAVEAVGAAGANFALEDVQLVVEGERARVVAAVRSYSERSPVVEIVADPEGGAPRGVLGRAALQLEPGAVATAEIELAAAPEGAIGVAVRAQSGDDGMALDDRALVVAEPARTVAMAWAGSIEGANRARWQRLVNALDGVVEAEVASAADLLATDGSVDGFEAPVVVALATTEGEIQRVRGPFLRDRSSVLLDGVTFDGVDWYCGGGVPLGAPALLDGQRVLAAVDARGERRLVVHLNLELGMGSVVGHRGWPALWSNLVEAARARLDGPLRTNLRSGEAMLWRLDTRSRSATRGASFRMLDPRGSELPRAGLRTLRWEAARPGIHRLLRDDREVWRYAVHFHAPAESDLTARGAESRPAEAVTADEADEELGGTGGVGRGERQVLAWLALVLLVADWWVLGRAKVRRMLA